MLYATQLVPATQTVPPFQPCPPHWFHSLTSEPPVEVGLALVVVMVVRVEPGDVVVAEVVVEVVVVVVVLVTVLVTVVVVTGTVTAGFPRSALTASRNPAFA